MSAGVPVVSGTILSGAQTIVLRLADHIIEHPIPPSEGGIVERVGRLIDRIEIHGIFYESGADLRLAQLSGFIGKFVPVNVRSFITNYEFYPNVPKLGIGVTDATATILFENLNYQQVEGHAYPYYKWVLKGAFGVPLNYSASGITSASGIILVLQNLSGITYTQDLGARATLFVDYSQSLGQSATLFTGYTQSLGQLATLYADYTQSLGQQASLFANYVQVS